ncbi:unnamed protein product [Nezara viridula]|uniref:Uncharacterized protein n=1 Tax=Nezara viridula TaxID=85310 RepID=A0A9P0MRT4_NEZVI|nr:unnamed protein product [Nezara viridula]
MIIKIVLISFLLITNSYCSEDNRNEEEKDNEEIVKAEVRIGALFDKEDETLIKAFTSAVELVNSDEELLPNMTLVPITYTGIPEYDSLEVGKKVCELMSNGVAAIFGPQSPFTSYHVQSLCDTMEMPHLSTKWDLSQRRSSCLLNIYPHPSSLTQAITDIVTAWNWKGFTVLYDDFDALRKIQGIIKLADDKGYLVTVRQLESEDDNYRAVLKEIKHSDETNIVIECAVEKLYNLLIQAQQVGLMGSRYNYIITTLDFQTINHEPFMWGGTNITGIRLVDPDDPYVRNATQIEERGEEGAMESTTTSLDDVPTTEPPIEEEEEESSSIPTVEAALLHDAVRLFVKALQHLSPLNIKPLECGPHSSLDFGYTVINYMRLSEIKGMTGVIKFNHEGFRTDIQLDVISLTEEGLKKTGTWNTTTGLVMEPPDISEGLVVDAGEDLRNKSFIVIIALTKPYNMLKEDSKTLTGNDRYEGFGVDLIHELSLMSGFNYTFVEQYDKNSGSPSTLANGTRIWSGMIGEVQAGRADLAIADITITRERERDVDFTHPFMNLGISILHRKPSKAPPDLFSFLSPFSNDVWGCMLGAYFGVSLLLFVMARLSPYEWTNPYPCIEEPEHLENQFSLLNSLWFTLGSVMQQGSDVAPISVSTRMVASIWWFFTLIMVSSYTANLAAFLTVENNVSPFSDVKELAQQTDIKYGAKKEGATANFFRDSKEEIYQKIYKFMMDNPDCMMPNNDVGVNRVVSEDKYAFFMESASIEYEVQRKCQLAMVGDSLDSKGYGIVMRQNSSYRNALNKNVVRLQENGKLTQLKDKWWKEKRGGGACTSGTEEGEASELNLNNVGGVFVVLVAGCLIGVLLSFCEVLWDISQRDEKISFKHELMEEIKFIIKCKGTVKPVRKNSLTFANCNNLSKSSSKSSSTSKRSSKNSFSFRLP